MPSERARRLIQEVIPDDYQFTPEQQTERLAELLDNCWDTIEKRPETQRLEKTIETAAEKIVASIGSSNYAQPPIPNAVSIALQIITPPADYFLERTQSCSPFVSIPLLGLAHKILKNYLEAELEGQTKIKQALLTNP